MYVIKELRLNKLVSMALPTKRELFRKMSNTQDIQYSQEADFGNKMQDRKLSKVEQLDTGARAFYEQYGTALKNEAAAAASVASADAGKSVDNPDDNAK